MSYATIKFRKHIGMKYNLTLEEFFEKTGCSETTVIKAVKQQVTPTIKTRHRLLQVLTPAELRDLLDGLYSD